MGKSKLLSDPELVKKTGIIRSGRNCYLNTIIRVLGFKADYSLEELLIQTLCEQFDIKLLVTNWKELADSEIFEEPEFNWDYMCSVMHNFLIQNKFKLVHSKTFSWKQLQSESVICGPSPSISGAKHYAFGLKLIHLLYDISACSRKKIKRSELAIYIKEK